MTPTLRPVTRREFVKAGTVAGAGLTIGFTLTGCGPRGAEAVADVSTPPVFLPNAFVRIGEDGHVLVMAKHLETGQGSYTGLATLVAEELDADWSNVRVEGAPADASKYNNLAFGQVQGTGGSSAMANSYEQMRTAGATARAMLVAAAAAEWKVEAAGLTTENGVVTDPASGKRATYGSLAAKAAALPVPVNVTLKDPATFRLIGKTAPRVDVKAKSTGKAIFTQDFTLPGMLTAAVTHPTRSQSSGMRAGRSPNRAATSWPAAGRSRPGAAPLRRPRGTRSGHSPVPKGSSPRRTNSPSSLTPRWSRSTAW
jgi:isoquinoline 1-oxidoreductase beta subunit